MLSAPVTLTPHDMHKRIKKVHAHGKGNTAILAVFVGKAKACAQGDLCTNYATSAIEVVLLVVHVHAATQALCCAIGFPHELCTDMQSLSKQECTWHFCDRKGPSKKSVGADSTVAVNLRHC